MINIKELALKLDNLLHDFDTYEYNDNFDTRKAGIDNITDILVNNPDLLIDILENIFLSDDTESKETAVSIISDCINYYDSLYMFRVSDYLFVMIVNYSIAA